MRDGKETAVSWTERLQNVGKRWPAIAAGILLAVLAELAIAWYGAGRGYGNESRGYGLEPVSILDYEMEDGRFRAAGEVPMILFQTEESPGHIHFVFREPLETDTVVVLYYEEDPSSHFDRFSRKERYMMEGTREAALTVPAGDFHGFRLEIRGDFVPESIQVVPAVKAGDITAGMALGQVRPWRMTVMGVFLAAGLCLWQGRRKEERLEAGNRGRRTEDRPEAGNQGGRKEERPGTGRQAQGGQKTGTVEGTGYKGGAGRRVWLDLVRALAAVLVIIVHVTEPAVLILPAGSRLHLAARAISLGALTCNLLFVLISGALLLSWKEEPVGVFVRKRLMSVVLPLAVYACFYVGLMCITQTGAGTWIWYYLRMVAGGTLVEAPHFWLVYVLAGLYLLVIPFRYMLRNLPERMEKLLTVTILVLLAVRTASLWSGQPVGISCFLGDWPGIFLLGYFLTRDWMRRYDPVLVAGGVGAFVLAFWLQGCRPDYKGIVCNQSVLMAFMSMAVFVTALRMERWLAAFARVLQVCSRYSYQVLLVHWFVLGNFIYNGWMSSGLPGVIQVTLPVPVCLALSLGIAAVTDLLVVKVLEKGLSGLGDAREHV